MSDEHLFGTTRCLCIKSTKSSTTKSDKFSPLYFCTKNLTKNRIKWIFTKSAAWCIIKIPSEASSASKPYFLHNVFCLRGIKLMIFERKRVCCAFFMGNFFEKVTKTVQRSDFSFLQWKGCDVHFLPTAARLPSALPSAEPKKRRLRGNVLTFLFYSEKGCGCSFLANDCFCYFFPTAERMRLFISCPRRQETNQRNAA